MTTPAAQPNEKTINNLLAEIAELEKVLTEKARDNKLTLEEMEGETIALSNLGAYSIDSFLAIFAKLSGSRVENLQ